jgi:hypothetical protein
MEGPSIIIRGFDHHDDVLQGEARILTKGKSSPKCQVKTVGLLETSVRFQCPERNYSFEFLNNSSAFSWLALRGESSGKFTVFTFDKRSFDTCSIDM